MHDRLVSNFPQCTDEGKLPEWMTKGRTFLLHKDIDQGNEPSNYRPITCLPLAWKILTGVIADDMCSFLEGRKG